MASGSRTSRPCRPMMERRPPMLKDFLVGDVDAINPCSSSSAGLKSFPGRLQRSRSHSRAAADATISALQKLLNAVKFLPSLPSAVKSRKGNAEAVARVRVKDILRWKSFTREVIDGQDYAGAAVGGESRGNVVVGREDPMWTGAGRVLYSDEGPTKKEDEEEQKSPVSVLDSPFTSHKQDSSSFDQSLANVEEKRERLMERIKWFETLAGVDPPCIDFNDRFIIPMEDDTNHLEEELDQVEETPKDDYTQVEYDHPKVHSTSKHKIKEEDCIGDMEKEATWSKFNEQCTQMGLELEMGMLNALLDELLFELVVGSDIV